MDYLKNKALVARTADEFINNLIANSAAPEWVTSHEEELRKAFAADKGKLGMAWFGAAMRGLDEVFGAAGGRHSTTTTAPSATEEEEEEEDAVMVPAPGEKKREEEREEEREEIDSLIKGVEKAQAIVEGIRPAMLGEKAIVEGMESIMLGEKEKDMAVKEWAIAKAAESVAASMCERPLASSYEGFVDDLVAVSMAEYKETWGDISLEEMRKQVIGVGEEHIREVYGYAKTADESKRRRLEMEEKRRKKEEEEREEMLAVVADTEMLMGIMEKVETEDEFIHAVHHALVERGADWKRVVRGVEPYVKQLKNCFVQMKAHKNMRDKEAEEREAKKKEEERDKKDLDEAARRITAATQYQPSMTFEEFVDLISFSMGAEATKTTGEEVTPDYVKGILLRVGETQLRGLYDAAKKEEESQMKKKKEEAERLIERVEALAAAEVADRARKEERKKEQRRAERLEVLGRIAKRFAWVMPKDVEVLTTLSQKVVMASTGDGFVGTRAYLKEGSRYPQLREVMTREAQEFSVVFAMFSDEDKAIWEEMCAPGADYYVRAMRL